ncbi:MAG TPA: epimerase, partial [Myxococcaceae bacterium]
VDPGMAFFYVSGVGTGGKAMWAQVKGRTEAALLGLFRDAYMVRLGMLRPVHGEAPRMRGARILYALFGPLAPLIQVLAPRMVITSDELGRAMIRAARERPPTHVLEMRVLQALARG